MSASATAARKSLTSNLLQKLNSARVFDVIITDANKILSFFFDKNG